MTQCDDNTTGKTSSKHNNNIVAKRTPAAGGDGAPSAGNDLELVVQSIVLITALAPHKEQIRDAKP